MGFEGELLTDVADLKERMTNISRKIRRVYRKLFSGSENHFRAFSFQMERL